MDPVNRLNQVLEVLRRQLAESSTRLETARTGPTSNVSGGKTTTRSKLDAPALRRRIQERLHDIDPGDTQRLQRARRTFLESVLAWEFGDDLLLDRSFTEMLDYIEQSFRSDQQLGQQLDRLINELLLR